MYKRKRSRRYTKRTSLAAKAYRLAKKAYKLPELKFNPYNLTGTSISSAAWQGPTEITQCAQGLTNNSRIGDQIRLRGLSLKFLINLNASATASRVRLIIFRYQALPAGSVTSSNVMDSVSLLAFKAENQSKLTKILYDKVIRVNSVSNTEYQGKLFLKLRNKIHYAEGSSTSYDNGIYWMALSDEATNFPTLQIQSRFYFVDP